LAIKNITVPDIGGASDVEVIEVLVKVGDAVKAEGSLLTLESDKATMDLPSPETGVIKELKVKVGDKVSAGTTIAVIETETVEKSRAPAEKPNVPEKSSEKPVIEEQAVDVSKTSSTQDIHAGPVIRKIAREFGIDLRQVTPTGPKNRILKEDVEGFVKSRLAIAQSGGGSALPEAPQVDFTQFGAIETQPLSRIKKLSGKNLHRNWLIVPHVTQFGEADITELESFRVSQKSFFEKQGIKLTPLVFIMKAVASALRAHPTFNASLDPKGENLILKKYIHIGVAVDTPEGLVVPVIRDVDKKGLGDLAKELSDISEKARRKQLTPKEMQGGSFSISSLGGIGGTAFTPIINVPEVSILGVSKSAYKPVYQNDQFIPRLMLPLSLAYDHRVIDGAEGARFITFLSNALSDIRNLLL